jgi:hypothetical protein
MLSNLEDSKSRSKLIICYIITLYGQKNVLDMMVTMATSLSLTKYQNITLPKLGMVSNDKKAAINNDLCNI